MKKFFNISILYLALFVASCGTTHKTPRAVNKPQKLTNINIVSAPSAQLSETTQSSTSRETNPLVNVVKHQPENTTVTQPKYESVYEEEEIASYPYYANKEVETPSYQLPPPPVVENDNPPKVTDDNHLRIAVILPLSGNNSAIAKELKNAATMALFNLNSDNIILQFYDSKGTAIGAKEATIKANEDNADVIVGPLFADEVSSAKKVSDVPIISFTTDQSVLEKNVFSIGFLIEQQIRRIVEYSIENGYKRFAIIVPDNETGNFIIKNFKKYTNIFDGEVVVTKAYKNKKDDLMKSVKAISNFDERTKEYKQYIADAKARLKYLNSLKSSPSKYESEYDTEQYSSTNEEVASLEKTLENLSKKTTVSDPDFDAIFIYGDEINDVIMIGSSLMYYDVHPNRIKFLGTSQLENSKIYSERAFNKAWYPSVSTKYNGKFNQAYKDHFGTIPNKIASLAYDAVSLVGVIAKDGDLSTSDILNPNGWTGINGIFRFTRDGSSERNMDVKEIVGGATVKTKVISPANVNFLY